MSPSGFDNLPCELLEAIADYLHSEDLDSFTLLNRACYSALVPRIFSSIGFRINEKDALRQDVTSLVQALERDETFKHVRALEIFGEWRKDDNPLVKFSGKDERQAWVTNRLHIRCFRLRSLLDNNELDGYEQKLATSPNLTTIFASFELFYEDYFADFGYRTIVKVASGIAPNLKEVRVNNFATSDACDRRARRSEFRPTPRKHVLPEKVAPKGALEVLELHGYEDGRGPIDLPCLELWDSATDLSRLRSLRLGKVEEEVLQWATPRYYSGLLEFPASTQGS
ncbi:hypothetical protein PRZ48_012744 [Zasmidium cellare]|uniref:F-box domain-containing protein n=1 Tax=Zasmidium cellare TaxID=395010 RepID=A0ABR0E6A7_ZASCE|nr:hypothetical protein PRZ48_012744 [Zasmidium cellare]